VVPAVHGFPDLDREHAVGDFLGGLQLLCMGMLGEYVARIFTETKGRSDLPDRQRSTT
jgi:hypothetical protein